MGKKKIKIGEINTKEIVNLFGTEKAKNKCKQGGYISGREKELLLNKAQKFCNIEDLGQGKFIIHKVYGVDR